MIKAFLPNEQVKSIFDIDPATLKKRGIKGIITDLDNTLVEWNRPSATPELEEWFNRMKKHGIQVTIVSNNNEDRVKAFAEPLNIPFIHKARKPMGKAFRKALKRMNISKEETVVIGDQLLTDILGGNRGGFYTILVVPVAQTDGFWTRINRTIERRIMNVCKKKGLIQWEDER
ncbi:MULTISPECIES: YqeG family HAD IIIA-type phosphatase [Bacillus]|uniref:HAD phosphatase, family IIIA n=1 Tax=Bacillus smithii 7_3_47FAA TaxID=665952 RepID=G9QPY4_9BACI|nr:YqeG family HAD IIIA-type phosphatase [Bacillus smithii]AKP47890.1 Hydrolase HAD subfamily IIIA [Bacillus smithii]EHL73523.1 HAD phosphatase, family IIIA [Bacillus smithii 7_3_47FAA]MED4884603.1 YqeG family HAD IIIA-type phosphatase [Bacillus smithii]MED4926092.1 YqeG family HAD IIIA-type phosphatase [Bacillus smithii]